MKYILSILTIFAFASHIEAQVIAHQLDSIGQPLENKLQISDSVKLKYLSKHQKLMRLDSLNKKPVAFIDSATLKINNAENKVQLKTQALDSIKNKKLAVVDSTVLKINNKQQSILNKKNALEDSLNQVANKYQSLIQKKTTSLIDSTDVLKKANLLHSKAEGKLDSINKLPANLAQKPQTEINKAQSKIQSVENSTTGKVDEKLSILSKQADGQGNLPGGVNLPKTDLGINKIVPGDLKMSNLKIDQTIPSINKPAIPGNVLDKKLGDDVSLPKGLGTSTPKELNGSTKFSETDKLLKSTGELSKASGKVAGYTGDIKNIEGGNLEKVKTLKEEAISNTPVNAELAEIQKQDRIIKDQQAKLQSYKNPEAYKKQVLARSKQMVALQMVTFEKQLQQTITQVSKYQGKLGTVLSETSAMSKKRDKLKRLRTYEKYVPGVTFQVLKPAELIIDVNPFLRYRLTSYWSIGLGWNERVLFGKSAQTYDHNRIYGVRAFTEVIIFKGVSFRLDAERMSTSVAIRPQTQDVGKRVDVWSYMAGIKKEFSFIPKIHGNVQFMYKIYASNIDDPYPTRCNVRFGFEYMANKRLKK